MKQTAGSLGLTPIRQTRGWATRLTVTALLLLHTGSLLFFFINPVEYLPGIHGLGFPAELLAALPAALPLSFFLLLPSGTGGAGALLALGVQGAIAYLLHTGSLTAYYPPELAASLFLLSTIVTAITVLTVTRFRRLTGTLLQRSYTDPVSELPNRFRLLEDIRSARSPALALVQAERYTEINSCFGYHFGTQYILNIQEIIEATLNQTLSTVRLYHVDKDTFAILEEYAEFEGNSVDFQERFRRIIRLLRDQTFSIDGLRFPVPVTAGISLGSSDDPHLLFNQAEQALTAALYSAQTEMLYTDSQHVRRDIVSHTNTLALVSHAIKSEMVEVEYQPIVENKNSRVAMYEALVRIRDEAGQLIPPGAFLFSTKLSSYHKELTKIVFHKTFRKMTGAGIMFTVNISMENITDEDFLPFLEELMNTYPASREHCILEITESEGVENYDDVRAFIESAHSQGYKIAIDDFGSGYSNFANIIRLPIDYIKFDGALIQQMNSDPRAVTVLSKMNEIAQALKIRTVAEFVDSRELHTIVKRCKIDYAQGFLLGKPSSRLAKRATQMET